MSKTTKIVIVAAVAAAIAMPALAFASNTSMPSTHTRQQRITALNQVNACRKKAGVDFLAAMKAARVARDAATKQARTDFQTAWKAAGTDKVARKAALAARTAAINKARDDYQIAYKAALATKAAAFKACANISSTANQ